MPCLAFGFFFFLPIVAGLHALDAVCLEHGTKLSAKTYLLGHLLDPMVGEGIAYKAKKA